MDDLFAEITIDAVLSAARGMREEERNRVPVFDERMRMVVLFHFFAPTSRLTRFPRTMVRVHDCPEG